MTTDLKKNPEPRALMPKTVALIMMGTVILALAACKSPTSTDASGEADIIVTNDYGTAVDIYMDGEFKFTIGDKWSIEIDDVEIDEHLLEAKQTGTQTLIVSDTIDVAERTDYAWTVDDPPDINIINNSDEIVKIYLDGTYKLEIGEEQDRWIMDVAFGERLIQAFSAETGLEVASITIKVEEYKDYTWTIE
jgi:hypothetical protein